MSKFVTQRCLTFSFVIVFLLLTADVAAAQDAAPVQSDKNTPANVQTSRDSAPGSTGSDATSSADAQSNDAQSKTTAAVLPNAPSQTKSEQEKELEKKEQSYRVLGLVPRFGTTHVNATPLTSKEKFHLWATSSYDPVTLTLLAAGAGIGQAENQHAGYGQGAQGFAKRYGAAVADSTSAGFFSNYLYPVIFKQDPRYFRLGEGSFKKRFAHSLVEQVVAHQDHGGRMLHFSNILGAISSGGLSNIYYPKEDRGLALTAEGSGFALMYGEIGGLFNEFWPDVQNRLMKKKDKKPKNPLDEPTATGTVVPPREK